MSKRSLNINTLQSKVDEYTLRVEELLEINLPPIDVKPSKNFADDLVALRRDGKNEELLKLSEGDIQLQAFLKTSESPMFYCPDIKRIYVSGDLLGSPFKWSHSRNLGDIFLDIFILLQITYARVKFYGPYGDISVVHEIGHEALEQLLQGTEIQDPKVKKCFTEGFAEFISLDFPEIYQDQRIVRHLAREGRKKKKITWLDRKVMKHSVPYKKGYSFFSYVIDEIGFQNLQKLVDNPPQTMVEINDPSEYIQTI